MLAAIESQQPPGRRVVSLAADREAETGPYRLDVFAADVEDAVTSAGGWLFDQVAGSWQVTAILAEVTDPRPLQILGVDIEDMQSALAAAPSRPRAQLVAAAADLLMDDSQLRQYVISGFGHYPTEIAWWGNELATGLDRVRCVHYTPSAAGSAFKRQALLASHADHHVTSLIETLWCGMSLRRATAKTAMAR